MDKKFVFDSYESAWLFASENEGKKLFVVSKEEYDDSYGHYEIKFIVCDEAEANRLVGLSHDDPYCYGERGSHQGGAGDIFQIVYRPEVLKKSKWIPISFVVGDIKGNFEEDKIYLVADGAIIGYEYILVGGIEHTINVVSEFIDREFEEKAGKDAYKMLVAIDRGVKKVFVQKYTDNNKNIRQNSIELLIIIDKAISGSGYFSTDVKALETAQEIINLGYYKIKNNRKEELLELAGIIDSALCFNTYFRARKAVQKIINLGYHK